MSLELITVSLIGAIISIGLYFAVTNATKDGANHKDIKNQLKNTHGLRKGPFASLKTSDDCSIWITTTGRKCIDGVSTFGTEVLQPPVLASVSISKECSGLFASEFMLLNPGGRTPKILTYKPAGPGVFKTRITNKFCILVKKPGLSSADLQILQDKTADLLEILANYRRYEITYRSDSLTVHIGTESIDTHSELVPVYECAVECMKCMQNGRLARKAA